MLRTLKRIQTPRPAAFSLLDLGALQGLSVFSCKVGIITVLSSTVLGLLQGSSDFIYVQYLDEFLTHSECYESDYYNYDDGDS